MQIKIRTSALKDVISKAIKISTNDKMLPLTSFLFMKAKNDTLFVMCTDATNYFEISTECASTDDFEVTVKGAMFSKIVSKITTEFITLELGSTAKGENRTSLILNGNGKYTIELPTNEEGMLIKYPDYADMKDIVETGAIKVSDIKNIITSNKPTLATNDIDKVRKYYYCGNLVASCNENGVGCVNKTSMFKTPVLIPSNVMDILSIFTSETINYEYDGISMMFTNDNMKLYIKVGKNIEDYPVEPLSEYANVSMDSSCTVAKSAIISAIDRLSIFISPYDIYGVYLSFTKDGLSITSSNESATELIGYHESENFQPFRCLLRADEFRNIVSGRNGEALNICYGDSRFVKFVDNKTVHILGTISETVEDDYAEDSEDEYYDSDSEDYEG
jgi:DNA polymerase III sliding clamp (beta) subunit (PCNA family)